MTPALRTVPDPADGRKDRATTADPVDLFTIAEAAASLRVPEGWLRKKVTAGAVPHTRLGKHVRFTAEHLRRIVSDGEAVPCHAPPPPGQGLSVRARRRGPAA